mmetsp:Transcript_7387/g.8589  ORF Transcript_7387/g.8589 Transcript_7387/m.8589 type:complete len:210 (-) Transcript_7387:259-888(-)
MSSSLTSAAAASKRFLTSCARTALKDSSDVVLTQRIKACRLATPSDDSIKVKRVRKSAVIVRACRVLLPNPAARTSPSVIPSTTIAFDTRDVIARAFRSATDVPRRVAPRQIRRGILSSEDDDDKARIVSPSLSVPLVTNKESIPGLVITDTTPSVVEILEDAILLRRRPPEASINVYCGEVMAFTEGKSRTVTARAIITIDDVRNNIL